MKGTKRRQKLKQPNHSSGLQGHTKRTISAASANSLTQNLGQADL